MMKRNLKHILFILGFMVTSLTIVLASHMVALVPAPLLVKGALQELATEKSLELEINGIPTVWKENGLYLNGAEQQSLKLMDFAWIKSLPLSGAKETLTTNLADINFEKVGFVNILSEGKSQRYWKVRFSSPKAQLTADLLFTLSGEWRNLQLKQGEMELDIWKN